MIANDRRTTIIRQQTFRSCWRPYVSSGHSFAPFWRTFRPVSATFWTSTATYRTIGNRHGNTGSRQAKCQQSSHPTSYRTLLIDNNRRPVTIRLRQIMDSSRNFVLPKSVESSNLNYSVTENKWTPRCLLYRVVSRKWTQRWYRVVNGHRGVWRSKWTPQWYRVVNGHRGGIA